MRPEIYYIYGRVLKHSYKVLGVRKIPPGRYMVSVQGSHRIVNFELGEWKDEGWFEPRNTTTV